MAVSFVATGTAWTTNSFGSTYTLNKPAGVTDGDLMIARVNHYGYTPFTITCTGWTVVQSAYSSGSSGNGVQTTMLYRFATSSEPASWTANASGSVEARMALVTAYRGVQTVGPSGQSVGGSGSSKATASVTNTVEGAWRVVHGAIVASNVDSAITSNETTRRSYSNAENPFIAWVQGGTWDSNGATVAVGSTSRTMSRSGSWMGSATVIVLLYPSTGTPATGTAAMTLPEVTSEHEAEVEIPGTLGPMQIPAVIAAADGYGQPPIGTGTLTAPLSPVVASASGSVAAFGPLATIVPISASMQGETRVHGVRVINVDHDDRVIKVESRGVAD